MKSNHSKQRRQAVDSECTSKIGNPHPILFAVFLNIASQSQASMAGFRSVSVVPMDKEYLLQVSNLSKSFPGVQAISGVSFDLERGTVHALQAVKDGRLDATVFQDARGQGGIAVETVVKILKREPFERQTFIPCRLVTRDNVDQYLK
jgi:hypothetical protein